MDHIHNCYFFKGGHCFHIPHIYPVPSQVDPVRVISFYYGSREGQFPRWRSAVRVRSEGSAAKAPQRRFRSEGSAAKAPQRRLRSEGSAAKAPQRRLRSEGSAVKISAVKISAVKSPH